MKTLVQLLLLITPLMCWPLTAAASGDHDHDHDHDHNHDSEHGHAEQEHNDHDHEEEHSHDEHGDDHGHSDGTTITTDMAKKVGLGTAVAGPGTIERQIKVYGRLVPPPDQHARIRARFPGVITAIRANLGDHVKTGDVLATIESNESLQTYQVRAPIEGVVHRRAAHVGDVTGEAVLFELINTDRLWAELKVFPRQRHEIRAGQAVHLFHGDDVHQGRIAHLLPLDGDDPYVLARVLLENHDHHAAPGDMINAEVVVEKVEVPLMVDNRALQDFENRKVVFVQEGERYEARPLQLGRSDSHHTEVLGGLEPGVRYVVENSYLIKADLGKSAAAHEH